MSTSKKQDKGLVLTGTDHDLFRWLWMLKVMTLGQLRRASYYQPETGRVSSIHNVRKRLQRLWQKGYIKGDTLVETRERFYTLEELGLSALRDRFGIRQQRLYHPRAASSHRSLERDLMISECAVRILEASRASALDLMSLRPLAIPFYKTHTVGDTKSKKHIERFVSQEDLQVAGHPLALRIRPDLVFALEQEVTQRRFSRLYMVHVIHGNTSAKKAADWLFAYHHYRDHSDPENPSKPLWKRYGDLDDFRVLLVTRKKDRVRSLARALEAKPGFDRTGIASLEALTSRDPLFDGIWTNLLGSGRALAQRLQ